MTEEDVTVQVDELVSNASILDTKPPKLFCSVVKVPISLDLPDDLIRRLRPILRDLESTAGIDLDLRRSDGHPGLWGADSFMMYCGIQRVGIAWGCGPDAQSQLAATGMRFRTRSSSSDEPRGFRQCGQNVQGIATHPRPLS